MPLEEVSLSPIEDAIDGVIDDINALSHATSAEKAAAIGELEELRERLHDICKVPEKARAALVRKFGDDE